MSSLGSNIRTQDLKNHSIWTLSAIGCLVYYITVMWHEIIGHGSMMYLFGVRSFVLNSTNISNDGLLLPARAQNGTVGGRLIAMNGAISNVILRVALYYVFRIVTRSNANLTWRVFLWLLAALNVFIGFIYPFYSGISGVADWSETIAGLPHHAFLRVLEVVGGAILSAGTVVFFARSFARFPESLWRLSLVPFCASAVVFCLAGLRIPNGAELMVISDIPAALLGQSILVVVTPVARMFRSEAPPAGRATTFSWTGLIDGSSKPLIGDRRIALPLTLSKHTMNNPPLGRARIYAAASCALFISTCASVMCSLRKTAL
jgi:hypothetical protein